MTEKEMQVMQVPEGVVKVDEFIALARWLATPNELREPKEQGELATKLGVDEATIWRWKQTPELITNRRHFIQAWLGDDLPELMYATKKFALRGSSKHMDIILKWLGELSETTINVDNRKIDKLVIVRSDDGSQTVELAD
jgi:hypothetical protein